MSQTVNDSNNKEWFNVQVVEAGGGGNCFFYSLFDALKFYNLLDCVHNIFEFNNDKEDFNIKFRIYLSNNLDEELKGFVNFYCQLNNSRENINGTPITQQEINDIKAQIFATLSENMRKLLSEAGEFTEIKCQDENYKNIIVENMKEIIRTNFNYVSEFEVRKVINLLKDPCNIILTIKYQNLNKISFSPNEIILYNIGEGHYQWFKKTSPTNAPPPTNQPLPKIKLPTSLPSSTSDLAEISSTPNLLPSLSGINVITFILNKYNEDYEKEEKENKIEFKNEKQDFKKLLLEINEIQEDKCININQDLITNGVIKTKDITKINFIKDIKLTEKIINFRKLEIKKNIVIIIHGIETLENLLAKINCGKYYNSINDKKYNLNDLNEKKNKCLNTLNTFIKHKDFIKNTLCRYADLYETLQKIKGNII